MFRPHMIGRYKTSNRFVRKMVFNSFKSLSPSAEAPDSLIATPMFTRAIRLLSRLTDIRGSFKYGARLGMAERVSGPITLKADVAAHARVSFAYWLSHSFAVLFCSGTGSLPYAASSLVRQAGLSNPTHFTRSGNAFVPICRRAFADG